ncbi:hypothetical protein D9Q98_001793 [Chlorella vulgaris]|uniref:Dehydrogenase/reductase SDR family member 4 n=1 Tax=Chlorella vulgaris TaxID=3077 RepID=A0A9D4Z022_CHLVU|nr:hypothetical protein D9Q98_001793 [Chlorella vulgaris]
MCRRLEGKVAIVTASTAGIGLGIVRRLASEGAQVVVSSRRQQNVDEAVEQLKAEGLQVAGCACHVGDKAQLQALVRFTLDTFGHLDILVSNAAVNPASGPILDMEDSAVEKILDINVKSPVLLAKAAVPHMPRGGSIVFVSSYTAFNPAPPIAMYAVSKTALLGLTKALAEELGPDGITVNCLAPGIVPTKFASALVSSPELEEINKSRTLLGRLGAPQDMAAAVAFLVSPDASYITGETLVVAGGMQSRL